MRVICGSLLPKGFSSGKLQRPEAQQPERRLCRRQRFPSQSFHNTNYYVDAVYNETDTTPLTVSADFAAMAVPLRCHRAPQ